MKNRLFPIVILILFTSQFSFSQNNDTSNIVENIEAYSSLMINASYTNNNLEYLTVTTEKPCINPQTDSFRLGFQSQRRLSQGSCRNPA